MRQTHPNIHTDMTNLTSGLSASCQGGCCLFWRSSILSVWRWLTALRTLWRSGRKRRGDRRTAWDHRQAVHTADDSLTGASERTFHLYIRWAVLEKKNHLLGIISLSQTSENQACHMATGCIKRMMDESRHSMLDFHTHLNHNIIYICMLLSPG